jgi:hypothetical protein
MVVMAIVVLVTLVVVVMLILKAVIYLLSCMRSACAKPNNFARGVATTHEVPRRRTRRSVIVCSTAASRVLVCYERHVPVRKSRRRVH